MIEPTKSHSPQMLETLARRTQRWPWAFPAALEADYALARRRQGRALRVLLLSLPALAVWALTGSDLNVLSRDLLTTPDWMSVLTLVGVAIPLITAALVARAPQLDTRLVRWAQVLAVLAVAGWLLVLRQWIVSQGAADHLVLTWLATGWLLVSAFGAYRWAYLLPGILATVVLVLSQDIFLASGGLMQREALLAVVLLLIAAVLSVHQDRNRRQLWLTEQIRRVQTRLDHLTGLPHRHEWNIRLARHWLAARREAVSLTLGLVDVCAFNTFNSTHGHAHGDRALVAVAEQLTRHLAADRQCWLVARYGDDQFAVLWRDLTSVEAAQRLSALRTALRAVSVLDVQQRPSVVRCRVVGEHCDDVPAIDPDALEHAARQRLAADKASPSGESPRLVPRALAA